ncbi:MAG: nucleotidyltransferase domain-containing protein [Nitrospira sp.]|nr:nucleotidyltransferase domain-containing protein [Nitrospira sp.]MCB9709683.1 nucleotidyltransferase domain-containing protein [Nitrospiraceae bacterium]
MSPLSHTILKVLVGSQAHGLAAPDSDRDYRSVCVLPTEEMFKLGFKPPGTQWTKGAADETSWEVGPFLTVAVQGHPLILETFLAPVEEATEWGHRLRSLFPDVWSANHAFESFVNYAHNQRQKFLEKKDGRPGKYGAAYLRVLGNLCSLLEKGTFSVHIADAEWSTHLRSIKDGHYRTGEVIDEGEALQEQARGLLKQATQHTNLPAINRYLIDLRRAYLTPV